MPSELLAAFRPPLVGEEQYTPRAPRQAASQSRRPPRTLPPPLHAGPLATTQSNVEVSQSTSALADELLRGGRPANVWSNSKRRSRVKHLIEQTSGTPGSGGRDISFMYDATMKQSGLPALAAEAGLDNAHLHVAASRATIPPTVEDDRYTTRISGDHPVPLPRLAPSGRAEALQLLQAMEDMLAQAGVDDETTETAAATDMHALLELVRKEQNMYSTCFQELIRQVGLEVCALC